LKNGLGEKIECCINFVRNTQIESNMITSLSEKLERQYIPPTEMFRRKPTLYSVFDSDGVPTHDASGKELSKSTMKKLHKNWEKQKKLFEELGKN